MEDTLATRIRGRLDQLGKTARGASLEAGLGPDAIRTIFDGRSRSPRMDTLRRLAEVLDCSVSYLVGTTDRLGASPAHEDALRRAHDAEAPEFHPYKLELRHKVAAGVWLSTEEWSEYDGVEGVYPVIGSPEYAVDQWLEQTAGLSSDLLVPEGALLHVIDAGPFLPALSARHVVVVERTRQQGALRERSLRQVEYQNGEIQLWGRSSIPRYNLDIAPGHDHLGEGDDLTTAIVGVVLRAYVHFTPIKTLPNYADPRVPL